MGKKNQKHYEDFPLSLALFDALPVIFFCCAMLVISVKYKNKIFLTGAVVCTVAGIGKVLWKIIIAASKKDITWLNKQLRFVMPAGFLLVLIGTVMGIANGSIQGQVLRSTVCSMPAGGFFTVTVLAMIMMSIFAVKLDGTKLRSNWIEQITNAIGQLCFLVGVILIM